MGRISGSGLSVTYCDEAYECDEDSFNIIDLSLRGKMDDEYYYQWLITFNPIDASSWLKARFYDMPDEDTLALTTNYMCNEWLSANDVKLYDRMKEREPERYKVDGLGRHICPA